MNINSRTNIHFNSINNANGNNNNNSDTNTFPSINIITTAALFCPATPDTVLNVLHA